MSLRVVVMGVSGCGKSTLGRALATVLGVRFVDADDLHPPENIEKMAAGQPLDDADRAPWLDRCAAMLAAGPVVLACSALKRCYRDRLRVAVPDLRLIHLAAPQAQLADRLAARTGHFMPAGLLASQFAALEMPDGEGALVLDAMAPVEAQLAEALRLFT